MKRRTPSAAKLAKALHDSGQRELALKIGRLAEQLSDERGGRLVTDGDWRTAETAVRAAGRRESGGEA